MYEINRKRIDTQSSYLLTCLQVLIETGTPVDLKQQFAVMRAIHIGVECMIDIGNTIIDGFIMRDPGGYLDIVDILEDEQVISSSIAVQLKEYVKFREQLVRHYHVVTVEDLIVYVESAHIFREFVQAVDTFLTSEQTKGNIYNLNK